MQNAVYIASHCPQNEYSIQIVGTSKKHAARKKLNSDFLTKNITSSIEITSKSEKMKVTNLIACRELTPSFAIIIKK